MATRTIDRDLGTSGRGFLLALVAALAAMALSLGVLLWAMPAYGADDTFPRTVVDDEGTEVVIEAFPERIISLSPANTEIVFALGAGERLVGGTDADDYPAEAAELADVVVMTRLVLEQVVALDPDLILAENFTSPEDIARMRDLGYPVVVLLPSDVSAVLDRIETIGRAVGAAAEAEALTSRMSEQIDDISALAAAVGSPPRTFYQIGSKPEIYAPAPESFVADMVALAGGEPVTTSDPAVFSIPLEELILADPEVIVVGDANYGVCPDDVAARPGWSEMTAVVSGDIRPVDDVPITRPGPRLAEGLAYLARAIHPELELADFPPSPPLCEAD